MINLNLIIISFFCNRSTRGYIKSNSWAKQRHKNFKIIKMLGVINNFLYTQNLNHAEMSISNTLALQTVLLSYKTWITKAKRNPITATEIKFIRITAKYVWEDYKRTKMRKDQRLNQQLINECFQTANPVICQVHRM